MENLNYPTNDELIINTTGKELLNKAGKWARFVAIVMYVCVAFMILGIIGILGMGAAFNAMGGMYGIGAGPIAFAYLIMAALYTAYAIFLNKFAKKTSAAILTNDTLTLNEGLNGLKNFFTLNGVLTIVGIVLGIIVVILMSAAVAAGVPMY